MSKETQKKIVVDIGNTHCKWGRVEGDVVVEKAVLPLKDLDNSWTEQIGAWNLPKPSRFILAGVNPQASHELECWLKAQNHFVDTIRSHQEMPIRVSVDFPEKVGLDRLLNALAVERKPAIIIDAGSAVTVDMVNQNGEFVGGAIFPGLRLMAESLQQFTAQLPKVEVTFPAPDLPARSTINAIDAGIVRAVAGGIMECVNEMQHSLESPAAVYLTGGHGPGLRRYLTFDAVEAPLLTLQGILIAARAGKCV
jgi:type III pantothenate kinase